TWHSHGGTIMSARLLMARALLALGVAAAPAVAQETNTLRGPWLGGGVGTASSSVNCDICIGDRNGGFSGYVAGGFRITPALHAGAEVNGWFDDTEGVSQRLLLYGASLWWHPQPGRNWFLKSALGLMSYRAATGENDDDPLTARAAAVQLGGGYDLHVGCKTW